MQVFGLFKGKSKPPSAMDAVIHLIYGDNPPRKSADLERSISIAHEDILFERVSLSDVKRRAGQLFNGPIPYSTHDLAVSTALAFFKAAEFMTSLQDCQIPARLRVANWAKDGKVAHLLAQAFEDSLYKLYKLDAPIKQRPKPFYLNSTREERQEWFAHTPPWEHVAPIVIDAILDGITDKVLLEAFVVTSTENGLVPRYELLGRENEGPKVIRAQISQILSETGLRAIGSLEKALEAKQMDAAGNAAALAANTFEPAISLAKNQVAAYIGMAHLCGFAGKREQCHDWARRGLAELEEMRPYKSAMQRSTTLPHDMFDQEEKHLRTLLEY